jgi:hypothetical protein
MRLRFCTHCGSTFLAKRSDAKFCSTYCRNAAYRERKALKGRRPVMGKPLKLDMAASFDDVSDAIAEARRVSNLLASYAVTGPRKLRPGCQRIADKIALAIKSEEW